MDAFASALEHGAAIARRDYSSEELTRLYLERIERLNPELNAVIRLLGDVARGAVADGLPDGPFKGVPFLLKDLSAELAPFAATVNNLAPGMVLTDRIRQLYGDDLESLEKSIPMGRLGRPDEFGAACAFLCSLQAGYITGQTIAVDGGMLRGVY